MHNLLINETTGSEGMMGGGEANHHFDHTLLVLFGNFNFICDLFYLAMFLPSGHQSIPMFFFNYSLGLAGLHPKF